MRKRFPHHTCQACSNACPVQAIAVSENNIVLDSKTCVRCGHCLFVCPVDALENLQPPERHFRHDTLVAPFSLQAAGVDELLMWHIQYGIRAVELSIDEFPGWVLAVAALNICLKALNEPLWQIIPPASKNVSVLRRHWLRISDGAGSLARVQASRHLRRHAFADISEYQLTIDTALCIVCRACERVCTEKAITFTEGKLMLSPTRCTGCDSCAVVCPTQSLQCIQQKGDSTSVCFHYTQNVCSDCQNEFSTFTPDDRRCPICQRHQYGMR